MSCTLNFDLRGTSKVEPFLCTEIYAKLALCNYKVLLATDQEHNLTALVLLEPQLMRFWPSSGPIHVHICFVIFGLKY